MLPRKCSIGLLLLGIAHMAWCQEPERQPHRYLIPAGYIGWVRISYGVENAKPLQLEDGFLVFRIPPSGLLNTSSASATGWAIDEYYFYDNDTIQRIDKPLTHIWAPSIGREEIPGKETSHYQHFFVGNEEEYQKNLRDGLRNVGPIKN